MLVHFSGTHTATLLVMNETRLDQAGVPMESEDGIAALIQEPNYFACPRSKPDA